MKDEDRPYEVPGNWVWTRLGNVAKWGSGGMNGSYTFASYLIRIRPIIINAKFLLYLLNSLYVRNQFYNKAKPSAGINNINSQELGSVMIPLPPVLEQKGSDSNPTG